MCVNGVWGTVCDQGWDKTDAHVVCTQLGHPELGIEENLFAYVYKISIEPVVFTRSEFGAGQYPIVFTSISCGGWENELSICNKQAYPQSSCSRNNVAGVLCGYGMLLYPIQSVIL